MFLKERNGKTSTNLDGAAFSLLNERKKQKKTFIRARAKFEGNELARKERRQPCELEFDIVLHRPIPEGGIIKFLKIVRRRVGKQFKYHICFSVEFRQKDNTSSIGVDNLVLGVDPGWRRASKVAHIAYSNPEMEDFAVFLPNEIREKYEWHNELKGLLDQSATEFGNQLLPMLKKIKVPKTYKKFGLVKKVRNLSGTETLSSEIAYKFSDWVRFVSRSPKGTQHDIFTDEIKLVTLNWLEKKQTAQRRYLKDKTIISKKYHYTNESRYKEMHGLRRHYLAWRDEEYKTAAAHIVSKGFPISIEDNSFSQMARIKDVSSDLGKKSRSNRQLAAPATFIDFLIKAAEREGRHWCYVSSFEGSSKTCHTCSYEASESFSDEYWVCPNCGAKHNRDRNAAINIARKGKEQMINGQFRKEKIK